MTRLRAPRRRRLAGMVAGGALVVCACGSAGGSGAGGDPGQRRLHQLAADPVFGHLPPDAQRSRRTLTMAIHRPSGFGSGGWSGPGVVVTFASAAKPSAVYAFYGRQAEADGWTAAGAGSLHLTDRWRKTYPDGARATLTIFTPRPFDSLPGPRTYRLSAGISLPG